jgi:hypothetical protein
MFCRRLWKRTLPRKEAPEIRDLDKKLFSLLGELSIAGDSGRD